MNQGTYFVKIIVEKGLDSFLWKNSNSFTTISIYLTFFLSCIINYLIFGINEHLLSSFHDAPIYVAFRNPIFIYFGLTVNIAIYFPTMMDLLLDHNRNKDLTFHDQADIQHNSWSERAFLAILNIACGLLLLAIRLDANFAYFYVCIHALQFVGNMGAVLILCRKLVPKYFTTANILGAQLTLAASSITLLEGFGKSPAHWSNILTFVFAGACSYFLFGKIFFPWLLNLWSQVVVEKQVISISESCALWYFITIVFVIFLVPGSIAGSQLFIFANCDINDIYIFLFSFTLYGIIVNTVPFRLARIAVEREVTRVTDTKQVLVRYMGHEVRTPLNVIVSGLILLKNDISNLQSPEERASLLDTVASMHQVSEDLLQTMNDLLLLEKMESDAFFIQTKLIPCSKLQQMAEKYTLGPGERN